MNPHQKNKVDIKVRNPIPPSHHPHIPVVCASRLGTYK